MAAGQVHHRGLARRDNELYRGKRRRLNVLALALSALAMLAVAVIVLFYAFQQYIVFDQDGISLELPLLATPEAAVDESGERVFEEVQVQLEIGEADYSNVEAVAGEGLEPLRAIFVPAASVNSVSVQSYVNLMGSYNANALVLEVKPTSGQLTWASSSETAEGFAVNGTQNMAGLVQSLKEQDIYLVAQVSCLVDDLMSERAATSALHLIGHTYLFLDYLLRSVAHPDEQPANRLQDFYIREAIDFVKENYQSDITVEDIAKQTGLNRSYFGKVFKAATGKSPQQYLIGYRMGKATELLKLTALPVAEVGRAVGYPNQLHFSRAFKGAFGVSPREWRRENAAV